jgi:hypothetical protein
MIVPYAKYQTSRDYRKLWELAHIASIICILDMQLGKPNTCRDIALTTHSPDWSPEVVQVGARGIGYVWAESIEEFIAQCQASRLEWLIPPEVDTTSVCNTTQGDVYWNGALVTKITDVSIKSP